MQSTLNYCMSAFFTLRTDLQNAAYEYLRVEVLLMLVRSFR